MRKYNEILSVPLKAIFKNSAAILISRLISPISFFLVTIIVARGLGPVELGKYSVVIGLCYIFELVSFLGLDNFIIREVSRDHSQAKQFLSNGLMLGIFSSAFFYIIMISVCNILYPGSDIRILAYIAGIILLPSFINSFCEAMFISLEKSICIVRVCLIREASLIILSVFFLSVFGGIYSVICATIASRIIGAILFIYLLSKEKVKLSLRVDPVFFRNLFKTISVFTAISILSTIFAEADIIILSKTLSFDKVGIYAVAKKILRMEFIFILSIITALFPVLSRAYHTSKDKFLSLFLTTTLHILLLCVIMVICVFFLAPIVIPFFFGDEFIAAINVTKILILAIIPLGLSFLFSRFLIIANQQAKDFFALIFGLISVIIGGIALSLRFGYMGMAIAVLASTIILASLHYIFLKVYVMRPITAHKIH